MAASAAYPYQVDPFRRAGLAQVLAMERDPGTVRGPVWNRSLASGASVNRHTSPVATVQ